MTAARQVKYVLLQLTFQLFQDPKTPRRSHTSQTQVSSWSKRVKSGGSAALTFHGARAEPFEVNKSPESESETPRAGLHGDPRWVWLLRRKTKNDRKLETESHLCCAPCCNNKKNTHSCKYVGVCVYVWLPFSVLERIVRSDWPWEGETQRSQTLRAFSQWNDHLG